jgi:hypothetical protein
MCTVFWSAPVIECVIAAGVLDDAFHDDFVDEHAREAGGA